MRTRLWTRVARRPLRRSVTALGRPVHARGRGDVEGRRFAPRSYVHFYATCVCLFPASRFPRRAAAIQYVPFVPRRLAFVCQAPAPAARRADEGRARPFTGPFTYTFGYVALYFRDGVVSRRDPKTGKFTLEKVPVYHIVDEKEKKKAS